MLSNIVVYIRSSTDLRQEEMLIKVLSALSGSMDFRDMDP